MRKKWLSFVLSAAMMISLSACGSGSTSQSTSDSGSTSTEETGTEEAGTEESAESGTACKDTITVAVATEAPMLDPTLTTSVAARNEWINIYEGLVTFDGNFEPACQLASSVEHSDDNTVWTFHLREGVKFHNGDEMTADDVVASLNRWAVTSGSVKDVVIPEGTEFVKVDDSTVEITLPESCAMFLYYMCNLSQYPAITTEECVAEADESGGYKDYIGTGPMKFVEWVENSYVHLTKFDEYVGPGYERSGYAGDAVVNFQDAYFYFITDSATRVNAALTGEYDIVEDINYDSLNQFEGNDEVFFTSGMSMYNYLIFNKNVEYDSIGQNADFRRAVQYALDMDEIAAVQCSAEDYRTVQSDWMQPIQTPWINGRGDAYYNTKDTDKAKEYLEASGYNGEEVTFLYATNSDAFVNGALTIANRLESELGLNIKLDAVDWATFLQRINQCDTYDFFITNFGMTPIPNALSCLSPSRTGFTNIEEITEYLNAMKTAGSVEEAQTIWGDCQEFISEAAVNIPLSSTDTVVAVTSKAEDYSPFNGISIWDVKIAE